MRDQPDARRHSIDLLRFVAAFGIVWAHMLLPNPWAAFGYTALSVFLILVSFLSVQHIELREQQGPRKRGATRYLRVRRILVPWLFWCLVFKILIVLHHRDLWALTELTEPYSLLIGPAVHLWFLPFILIASAVLLPLSRATLTTRRAVVVASILAALVSAASLYLHDHGKLPEPFCQWAFALPPFLYGLLAAYGRKLDIDIAPAAFFLGVCLAFMMLSDAPWPVFSLLAMLVFILALMVEPRSATLHVLGTLSFGIYLLHPIFIVVWHRLDGAGDHDMAGAVAVFILSAIASAILLRTPFLRSVV